MAVNYWKWVGWLGNAGMAGNSQNWLELAGNGRNGWKWLENDQNDDDDAGESNGMALSQF